MLLNIVSILKFSFEAKNEKIFILSSSVSDYCVNFFSCSNNKNGLDKRVIIAIPADVTTFNPMFAVNAIEGNISELIYLGLAELKWDQEKNDLEYAPSLAKSWDWSPDSLSLTDRKSVV